ncbi:MAG TPA: hypothetical protein PK867_32045, partial [Pirellulales bacterium]|nr:hypothetical protein [Pirellulales bacterium]
MGQNLGLLVATIDSLALGIERLPGFGRDVFQQPGQYAPHDYASGFVQLVTPFGPTVDNDVFLTNKASGSAVGCRRYSMHDDSFPGCFQMFNLLG